MVHRSTTPIQPFVQMPIMYLANGTSWPTLRPVPLVQMQASLWPWLILRTRSNSTVTE